jgi:hypothetical protein
MVPPHFAAALGMSIDMPPRKHANVTGAFGGSLEFQQAEINKQAGDRNSTIGGRRLEPPLIFCGRFAIGFSSCTLLPTIDEPDVAVLDEISRQQLADFGGAQAKEDIDDVIYNPSTTRSLRSMSRVSK